MFGGIEGCKAKTKEEGKVRSKLLENIIVFYQQAVLVLEMDGG